MFDLESFWIRRLSGASPLPESKLDGWISTPPDVPGFVEPALNLIEGDPEASRILIISAPGAVGKSTFANKLGRALRFAAVDLSRSSPLGGNFFKGGIANAFGIDALSHAANGKLGVLVDALDEGQLRATPEAYSAGLLDLASITKSANALPTVLFGRTLAAEEAWLLLTDAGYSPCLLQIDFFDDEKANTYLKNKLPLVASRSLQAQSAYEKHPEAFFSLAVQTRRRLTSLGASAESRFAGYAPVLDAICSFTVEDDALNPQARLTGLEASTQIGLVRSVSQAILDREAVKLRNQLLESCPGTPEQTLRILYTPDEQLYRISSALFGGKQPPLPITADPRVNEVYTDMVTQFAPQHPFLDGKSTGPANLVFAAFAAVWAMTRPNIGDLARAKLRSKPELVSGVIFDLYRQWLDDDRGRLLLLPDVGILYEALKAQITSRQRASLEISEEEDSSLRVSFEIVDRTDDPLPERTHGPYLSSAEDILHLQTPVTNVSIQAPIWVSIGDGTAQLIGAPCEINVKTLTVAAKQLLVHASTMDNGQELQNVVLIAEEAECQSVQTITVRDAVLSVTWPGSSAYPWTQYAVEPKPAKSPEIDFMRRRLRRILTAFRSHSKGQMVRLAAKINHLRMTKDTRGAALVDRLLEDGILMTFDAGKFYILDPSKLSRLIGLDYQDLQSQRFNDRSDVYLENVLAGLR